MRLKSEQVSQIGKSIQNFIKQPFHLYLYGSRVNDEMKGGDIDLLIVTSAEGCIEFQRFHLDILVLIKKQKSIGDRRIDIKAVEASDLMANEFLKTVQPTMVKIFDSL